MRPAESLVECVAETSVESNHRPRYADYGDFPLSSNPNLILHVLTECCIEPKDLAHLEATCSFFRQPANFAPDMSLSLAELAAFDMCQMRAVFKPMNNEERQELKRKCGGSWKLVLKFLKAGESGYRRELSHVVAGSGHSVVVTRSGAVYTFGSNGSGELGHGTSSDEDDKNFHPRLLRSLNGIRIIQAAAGRGRTMLISDAGKVYAFGKHSFCVPELSGGSKSVNVPKLVESLDGIFIVQAAIGNFFTAVLSREGRVYTFSWGRIGKLGHYSDPRDQKPHLMKGPLDNVPVAQIAAGYCYLLALAFHPNGMSLYSVGCGLGGKLGHGSQHDERQPKLIEHFLTLNVEPIAIAAGAWHAAVVARDGRVCTWGWGRYGCLGHGQDELEVRPKVVEALQDVKAVHVAAGDCSTFVVTDTGDVYSFGCGESRNLGLLNELPQGEVMQPELVGTLKEKKEKIVQISVTNTNILPWSSHTLALAASGRVYSFGTGEKGQLGIKLLENQSQRGSPQLVNISMHA